MAQILQIPFSFEFRKRVVDWNRTRAHLIGWAISPDGGTDFLHLSAKVDAGRTANTVTLRLGDFSVSERKCILACLNDGDGAIERDVSLHLFFPDKPLPLTNRDLQKHTQPADAWQMREEFLRMKPTAEGVETFLGEWGRWNRLPAFVEAREMFALQRAVRNALVSSPDGWFASSNAFSPSVRSVSAKFPFFALATDVCRDAICIATTVDLLRRVKFKTCARGDCELPFEVVSKHAKQYCSQYCAHLESVRRSRREKAETRKKGVAV